MKNQELIRLRKKLQAWDWQAGRLAQLDHEEVMLLIDLMLRHEHRVEYQSRRYKLRKESA
jgi:hypothetical protein